MVQSFLDILSGVGEPFLLSLAIAGVLLIGGGTLFLLLSGGVHFAGFSPPDPTRFPKSSSNLRRIGIVLIAVGLTTVLTSAFLAQWDAGSAGPLSDDLRASRQEVEKLSQEAHEQNLEIAALNQKLVRERNHRQKIESRLSEAAFERAQSRQELADARENIGVEYINRIDELAQTVDALEKKGARTEERSAVLEGENQELAKDNELLRADLEASAKKITELEMALADAKKKLTQAVGKDGDDAEAEHTRKIFAEINQKAGDYLALLFYQNPDTYFDKDAAIRHIAYALSGDLSFFNSNLKNPKELARKMSGLTENYRNFGYVDGYKEKSRFGYEYYSMHRLSRTGVAFFELVFQKYRADDQYGSFLERLKRLQGTASGIDASGEQN